MPKLKTRRNMAKRIRVTRNGKLVRAGGWRNHKLEKKSAKRKRTFRKDHTIVHADATEVRRSLGI
ncbi:MAG: 50S ribosomal protein L35 [Candidatus Dormibacteraceae bacterium]